MVQDNNADQNVEADILFNIDNNDSKHISISIKTDSAKITTSPTKTYEEGLSDQFSFSEKVKRNGRLAISIVGIAFLFVGRYSVPDDIIPCVEDKIMDALQFANDFINAAGNEAYRSFFQILCSVVVDITFIITFVYWVLKGKSGRLPITLAIFYITRALVQKVAFMPYPQGWYWYDPGFPSLVVPYGRGSDFFFSGHAGFMVICASEWHALKNTKHNTKVRNFVIGAGIYTVLILLVYRIHYFIDVFTGLLFAEWVFCKVDRHKDALDRYFAFAMTKLKSLLGAKGTKIMIVGRESPVLAPQEQEQEQEHV
jgi:hypothetical protein